MNGKKPKWSVKVVHPSKTADYRTVFEVGFQGFELARVGADNEDAKEHCEFIRDMFLKALTSLGITP